MRSAESVFYRKHKRQCRGFVRGGQALLDRLTEVAPDALKNRYKLTDGDLRDEGLMDKICIKRGCLNKGEPDRERCAAAIIDDFRKGRMGRVSLEAPQAEDEA